MLTTGTSAANVYLMISFIIPVYNKGEVLFRTLTTLIKELNKAKCADFEMIVVNDGSTDDSFTEAVRFKQFNGSNEKIKIFHYSQNIGKGFALRFGFSKSRGDPVVFLDGDMDIDTRQIIQAIKTYHRSYSEMVIGSKYHPLSRIHYPPLRVVYSLILKQVIRLLFNLSISDTQVGLKVFKREVLSEVLPCLIIKRFAVDLELLVVAHMYGFRRIVEVPVTINHTSANKSSIDLWAVKNFCQDICAIWYRKNILKFYTQETAATFTSSFTIQTA